MPAALRTTRAGWVDAGLSALASGGPGAVRVEPIAAQLGVTKGGFYRHFADRTAFLSALLDEWERRSVDEVIARVEAEGADAAANVRRAGPLTFAKDLLPIDLAVRAWARSDSSVAMRLRRVDNARIGYLRTINASASRLPVSVLRRWCFPSCPAGAHGTTRGQGVTLARGRDRWENSCSYGRWL